MNDQQPCEEWAEKLAARHQEDLTPQDHRALEDHLATCPVCKAQYQIYQLLEARIRELPSPELPPSILPILRTVRRKETRLPVPFPVARPETLNTSSSHTGRRLAFVVGVNSVASAHVPDLHYAERDAQDFATVLQESAACELITPPLLGERATKHNIQAAFALMAQECRETDEVIVYIAGHGLPIQTEQETQDFALRTYDSGEPGLIPYQNPSPFSVGAIRLWLKEKLKAHRVLLILDCCYTGEATAGERAGDMSQWTKARVAEYFDQAEEQNREGTHSLTLVASVSHHMISADPNGGESFPDILQRALLRKDSLAVDRADADGIDLQQVYRYLEQTDI